LAITASEGIAANPIRRDSEGFSLKFLRDRIVLQRPESGYRCILVGGFKPQGNRK
jgi:hypothetical protein